MKWTKETPNQPGWYWNRDDGFIGIIHIDLNMVGWFPGIEEEIEDLAEYGGEWCGPLEPPE